MADYRGLIENLERKERDARRKAEEMRIYADALRDAVAAIKKLQEGR